MNYNISKELVEAVTGIKDNFWIDGIHIEFENGMLNMTVYEFFFKCKDWAYGKGYELESSKVQINSKFGHCSSPKIDGKSFISETEQQSVFDACQWILDKDKQ